MNVLETEWWTMAVPPEWWADQEEDSILVGDRDDVGCIEISTLHRDSGEFEREELSEIAEAASEHIRDWRAVRLGEFAGISCDYVEDDAAIREWYVARGPLLLFVTYSCDEENRGMDDAPVDDLLDTLLPVESRSRK